MKKVIKSVVSMVLVFVMVFGVFTILPSEVFHSWYAKAAETLSEITGTEETYVSGDYTYTLVDEYTKVKITSYSGEDEALQIPEQIDGKDVSIIGDSVFYNKTFIKTVIIPDTVTTIGDNAFNSCTSMTDVTFGKNVKTIGNYAFNYCTSLKSVNLPDSIESIGDYAFRNDDAITEVTFGNGIKTIGSSAFYDCDSITDIRIPSSLTYLGNSSFANCDSLKNIEINGNGATIGNYAFEYGYNVESIVIGDGVKNINYGTFYDNRSLKSLTISDSVETIGDYAFYNCRAFEELALSEDLKTIGNWAFQNCIGLKNISIGKNLSSISSTAFYGDTALENIEVSEDNATYSDYDGALLNKEQTSILLYPKSKAGDYTIPDTVTSIGDRAFENSVGLTGINTGNGVKNIGVCAFNGCTALKNAVIGDSVETIAESAFNYCTSLKSVKLPDSVESIGDYAFRNDDAITEVTFGNGIKTIGNSAFYDCDSITAVRIPSSLTYLGNSSFANCDSLKNIEINGNGATIGNYAFEYCNNVESIVIGDGVKNINYGAFYDNRNLKSLTISDSVETIGDYAFYNCRAFEELALSEDLKTIGNWAFQNCIGLKNISIGKNLSSISSTAFYGDTALENIEVSEDNATYSDYDGALLNKEQTSILLYPKSKAGDYTIPDTVTSIGDRAFENSVGLTGINTGNGVKNIGVCAFNGCTALKNAVIGDSVETIAESAFNSCTSMTDVTFGKNVKTIGNYAFNYCASLKSVKLPDSVESIGSWAFRDDDAITELTFGKGIKTINDYAFYDCGGITSVKFPSSLTSIGYESFRNCSSLKEIEINGNGATIGNYAFEYCYNVESIVIGDGVKNINYGAFYDNRNLKSLTISDSVETIGDYAFYNCRSLTQAIFGKGITSIGNNAFTGFSDLTTYCHEDSYTHNYLKNLSNVTIKLISENYFVVDLCINKLSNNSVTFTWKKPNGYENIDHYIINKDGVKYDETNDTSYTDTKLESGREYTYSVCAVDTEGVVSESRSIKVIPACSKVNSIMLPNGNNKIGGLKSIKLTAEMNDNLSRDEAVGKFVYSADGEQWYDACTAQTDAKGNNYIGYWNLADVRTGDYTLRFVFTDKDGGQSFAETSVNVDRTHPAPIDEVTITPLETTISLDWQISAEYDTNIYRIYRSTQKDSGYSLISEIRNRDTLTYSDKKVAKGLKYYYYIVGVDQFGQESLKYDIVSAGLIDDTVSPVFVKMSPANGTYIYGKTRFTVNATDNVGVSKTELYYSLDPEAPYESWNMLISHNGSTFSENVDTTVMPSDVVYIVAKIYDAAGNYTYSTKRKYMCDNIGPEKVQNVQCVNVSGTTATLSWSDVSDEDISYFIVESKNSDGTWSTAARSNTKLGVNLSRLTPETTYTYRVIGYDLHGNRGIASDEITVKTEKDTIAPKVTSFSPSPGYYKDSIPLSFTCTDDYIVKTLEIQVSTDNNKWNKIAVLNADTNSSSYTFKYNLSLSEYKEGSLYIRGIVSDSYGNKTQESDYTQYEYIIDRTAPAAPTGVSAESGLTEGGSSFVCVSWNAFENDSSFSYYRVYRSTEKDGNYTLIKDRLNTVNFYDTNVEFSSTYYYTVEGVDLAGNYGNKSNVVECRVSDDTTKPVILDVSPTQNIKIGNNNNLFSIAATDNARLQNLKVEYKTDAPLSFYTTLKEITDNTKNSCSTTVSLPLDKLTTGTKVTLRISASDSSGNKADEKLLTYIIDKDAPQIINLSLSQTDDSIFTLNWATDDDDASYFYVYRKRAVDSSYVLYDSVMAESGKSNYSYTDDELEVTDKTVQYKVESHDSAENTDSAETEVTKINGVIKPTTVINCQSTVVCGSEYMFDASASTDDGNIVSYTFDFGDGIIKTVTNGQVLHTYSVRGTYSLKVMTTDDDGNTDTATKSITVTSREIVGKLNVVVKDDSGKVLPNTPVYVDLGESGEQSSATDSKGNVSFNLSVGTHIVSSFKNKDYLPVKQTVAVTGEDTTVTLVLINEPIVTGEFEIHKMTFEEIKAAGIDINAAENRHVVKLNVRLYYDGKPKDSVVYVNKNGVVKSNPIYVKSGGCTRKLIPFVIGGGGLWDIKTGEGNSEETVPALAYIDIPVDFSYLKDFFNVSLHVINHASDDFTLYNNTVKLNIPDGLSLVSTNMSESNEKVFIKEIQGGTQETVNWVLRGDKTGEYEISADYSGTISYFDKPIKTTFVSEDKIKVEDASKMDVVIEAEEETKGSPIYYNVLIKNSGNYTCYDFKRPSNIGFAQEFISVDGISSPMYRQISMLKSGESVRYHYKGALSNMKPEYDKYYFVGYLVEEFTKSGCNVIIETHPTKYFTEFTNDYSTSNEEEYTINVVDKDSNPIKGATVQLGTIKYTSDENGQVVVPIPDDNPIYFSVTKSGYFVYEEKYYEKYCIASQDTITLYDESEICVISSVITNGDDLLQKTAAIDNHNESDYVFYIHVFGDNISSVDLYQNDTLLNSINNQEYDNIYERTIPRSSFKEGSKITVKAKAVQSNGSIFTTETTLNARVVDSSKFPKFDDNFNIEGFSSIAFTVPDDVPIIGGNKFNLDYGDVSDYIDSDDSDDSEEKKISLKPSLSVKVVEGELFAGINLEIENILAKKSEAFSKSITDKISDKLEKFKSTKLVETSMSIEPKLSISGYFKLGINEFGDVVFTGGGIYLMIGVEAETETQMFVAEIPVVIGASFKLTATGSVLINVDPNTAIVSLPTFGIDTELELGLSAGFGVQILHSGFYGKGSLALNFNNSNDEPFGLDKATLSGNAGFYFSVVGAKYEQELISNSHDIYNRSEKNNANKSPYYVGAEYDAKNYTYGDVDVTLINQSWNSGSQTLLQKVNSDAKPQIFHSNGKTIMAYLGSADTSVAANNSKLYYSVLDDNSNHWSAPVAIDSSNQFTDSFELKEINGNVYLGYVKSNKEYSQNPSSINEAASNREVYVASFNDNSNCFTKPVRLTENDTYDNNVQLTEMNGKPAVVWANNSENNAFAIKGNNSIWYSVYSDGDWSKAKCLADNIGTLISLDAGNIGNTSGAAVVIDSDGNLTTTDDRAVKFISLIDGSAKNIDSNSNCSRAEFAKFNGKNVLLWSKNSSIMSLESLEKDAVILAENVSNGCANSFELLESESGNNAIVYSDTDSDNKTSVYVMYRDNEIGKFSSAVKLVTSDNYIESPSVIYVDDNLSVAYLDTKATIDDSGITRESSLNYQKIKSGASLLVSSVDIDYSSAVIGHTVSAKAQVTNAGDTASKDFKINVKDSDGNVILIKNVEETVNPGETKAIDISFIATEQSVENSLNLNIEDESGNKTSKIFDLDKCDVSITAEQLVTNGKNGAEVSITGSNDIKSGGQLEILDENGNAAYTQKFLPVRANKYVTINIDDIDKYADKNGIVTFRVVGGVDDYNTCNNIFTLKLYDYSFNNLDGDVLIGDIDLDGVITIKDVTLLQKYLADVSDLSDKALIAADVDKDGTIDICDATKIRSYLCNFADKNIGYCGQRSR